MCFKERYQKKQTVFIQEQKVANEDENIILDVDEPMDGDTTSQSLQASNILDNVYATSVILEGELVSADKQLLVTTMESYNSLLINFKII